MKKIILPLVFIFLCLGFTTAEPISKYIDKTCNGNICTETLYSSQEFVQDGDKWINIRDASSLKDTDYKVLINYGNETNDPRYLEVQDFNFTSITLSNIGFTDPNNEITLPDGGLKNNPNLPEGMQQGFDIPIKVNNETIDTLSFSSNSDFKDLTLNWTFGDSIHLGNNSTTISLYAPNQNIADIDVIEGEYTNYSSGGGLDVYAHTAVNLERRVYFSFNLTGIPFNNILNATLKLVSYYDTGNPINISQVLVGIDENRTNWFNQPCGSYVGNLSANDGLCNTTIEKSAKLPIGTNFIDLTNLVNRTKIAGYNNLTFVMYLPNSTGLNHRVSFYSKEHGSNQPTLNVTYFLNSPTVSISAPTGIFTQSNNVFNLVYSVDFADNCSYSLNGGVSNSSAFAPNYSPSFIAQDGQNTVTLYCINSEGLIGTAQTTFEYHKPISGWTATILKLILGFFSLTLLGGSLLAIKSLKENFGDQDSSTMVKVFVVVIIGIVLLSALAVYIGGLV